jgi:signal transduction histidine kinase/sensor domain CHASE-containing protein
MSGIYKIKWLPFITFILLGILAIGLWQDQNNHDRELVLRHIESSAEQLRMRVEGVMNSRLASLELMGDRWVERQPPDFRKERFQTFAASLSKNYPGFTGIFWLDPSGMILWVFPEDNHIPAIGKKLDSYPYPGAPVEFDNLKIRTHITITPCVHAPQGKSYFHAIRPLIYKNDLQGYLGGFFSIDQIMSLCLTKELMGNFDIRLFEESRPIYQHGYSEFIYDVKQNEKLPLLPHTLKEIRFGEKTWTILLSLDKSSYSNGMRKNIALLSFGLALAAAISMLMHLLIKRIGMYKTSRDQAILEINQRKQAQAALHDNEKKLELLLDELTAKNAELESFVYTVSHDLKTPIVTIEGFIGALREDFSEILSSDSEQYLNYISDAAHKMELLINELLNYSRIGRLEEKKTEFSMTLAVQEAMTTLRPQIERAGLVVDVQTDLPLVYADFKRIEQVIYNILSNAVKYIGQNNTNPRIDIGCKEQNSEKIFWVQDNGIGIDHRYFDKIFMIFERLPAAKSAAEGTGIGLAIVKRIIENHGGRIWLTSELNKGSTFYFTLKKKEAV